MNVWCGVIVLCLYELSAGFPAHVEHEPRNLILVGGNTRSVYLDVIGGKEERNGMSILQAFGQGIGAILGSWLSSLANALGIVLEGVSTTLVTPAPGQPVQPSNNAVLEPSSDVTKTVVANGRRDVNVTSDQPPETKHGVDPHETESD